MAKTKPFDEHFEDYEKWFDLNKAAYESEIRAIKHFIPDKGLGVEIGIGSGLFAAPLGITRGVEPSFQMRRMTRERGLKVTDGVAENIPLESDCYDYVLMVTTVCFVENLAQSLKEVRRVLRTGGSVIIGFVDRESRIGKAYQANKQVSRFYKEAKFYSAGEIEQELKNAGFKHVEFVQTLFGSLKDLNEVQKFEAGHGEGSFVVVKAQKR